MARKETKEERRLRELEEFRVRRAAMEAERAAEEAADKAFRLRDEVVAPNGARHLVSTVNRASSALAMHGALYAETMVWEINEDGVLGGFLWQGSASKSRGNTHNLAVSLLTSGGIEALTEIE